MISKTNKKRVLKFIVIVIIIASLIGFIPIWNSGFGLPSGYKTSGGFRGNSWGEISHPLNFYIDDQSYSLKYKCTDSPYWIPYYEQLFEEDDVNFDYDKDRFYIHKSLGIIYKETNSTVVSSFIKNEKDWIYNCEQGYGFIFYDDNYIYYISKTRITRFVFDIPTHSGAFSKSYMKYEFYRLNLDNGQNEKIDGDLFVEKINKYDDTIKIKS